MLVKRRGQAFWAAARSNRPDQTFCMSHDVNLNKVVEDGDAFKNFSLFEDYANTIVGNEM